MKCGERFARRTPPRPSTRFSTLAAEARSTVANQRQAEPAKLMGLLRGDLDWVVMKALEKDRTRRYETANDFAMDVKRFLDASRSSRVPQSGAYRLQSWCGETSSPSPAGAAGRARAHRGDHCGHVAGDARGARKKARRQRGSRSSR